MNILDQITQNTMPGPDYEEDGDGLAADANVDVRLIAFYLPQFHSIPENDEWWGRGFTEWTNVTKAIPRFASHLQPRLPGALGFYRLTDANVLREQAGLARKYGVAGFCFHHYWFSGRRLLESPIDLLMAHPEIEMPFCINWANESWSRRWDGDETSVLMPQAHSDEDDIAFARSIEAYLRDPRYLRVNDRPLLMVYRPGLLPDAAATVARWRVHFASAGIPDPYIIMAEVWGETDPGKYGMDASAGFPPMPATHLTPGKHDLQLLDPNYRGSVFEYSAMVETMLERCSSGERSIPGVCPSWDNEARKPGRGVCFTGSTPALYGSWLRRACAIARRRFAGAERMVFINAWNEWAEGAYLEPDRHFGYAYLAETARALTQPTADLNASGPGLMERPRTAGAPVHRSLKRRTRRLARIMLNRVAGLMEDAAWRMRGN